MTQFPAVIELSSLDGSNGFQINGEAAYDGSGYSVSSAGDVNGDGFADLMIGAPFAHPNGANSGAFYVVFGKASGFGANLELSSLDGSNGFQINGEVTLGPGGYAGSSVSSAGDINGDGLADLIIGAPFFGPNGYLDASYVVFGLASGFSANLELSSLNGSNGFQINGGDWSVVSSAGDINGDGFADLIVGAPYGGPNGQYSGASYVVFGKASGFGANLELSSLDGSNGFQINGEATCDFSGGSVSSAGDVNGDGFDDLIVGALGADPHGLSSGASYVVFGKASGFGANLELWNLNGSNGFKINGEAAGDLSGLVSSAGDVNGDGFADVIIGDYHGEYYVVFGKASGFTATLELSSLDGANGFQINGEASGWLVASAAGDVNGDGFADLIIGDGIASHVVFGKASGFTANLNLSSLDGSNGFRIAASGSSVSSAGDVNDDGFDDIIIGDPSYSANGIGSGASYVVFGHATSQGTTYSDFNGDIKADLLWQNNDGAPAIWLMNGTAFIGGAAVGGNPGSTWHVKGAGDFNADSKSDILWQNDDGTPVIWFMDGTTMLSGGVAGFNPGAAWNVIDSGDFNGDGKADILWQNSDGTPAVWLMNGTTLLSGAALSSPGAAWQAIGAGDFNGDGKSDILWQHNDGTAAVWLMNGSSLVGGEAIGSNPGTSWQVKAAGDFNGDGKSDILWQNNDGTADIWFMNGTSFVSGGVAGFNPGAAWDVVGASDFNGDGKADIAWQNSDGTPAIWLMDGTTLLSGASYDNPGAVWHVIASGS